MPPALLDRSGTSCMYTSSRYVCQLWGAGQAEGQHSTAQHTTSHHITAQLPGDWLLANLSNSLPTEVPAGLGQSIS
jgi:hypothetical protein